MKPVLGHVHFLLLWILRLAMFIFENTKFGVKFGLICPLCEYALNFVQSFSHDKNVKELQCVVLRNKLTSNNKTDSLLH